MKTTGQLQLQSVATGLRFGARFASGRETTFDSGPDVVIANPVEALLGATAACVAMDVISILRKKRHVVTAYEVEMEGERSETHPRRFTSMAFTHRVTGRAIPAATVEEIVAISESKYCSVRHTLDPAMRIESRVEVAEAGSDV
jgi:putative redox protein